MRNCGSASRVAFSATGWPRNRFGAKRCLSACQPCGRACRPIRGSTFSATRFLPRRPPHSDAPAKRRGWRWRSSGQPRISQDQATIGRPRGAAQGCRRGRARLFHPARAVRFSPARCDHPRIRHSTGRAGATRREIAGEIQAPERPARFLGILSACRPESPEIPAIRRVRDNLPCPLVPSGQRWASRINQTRKCRRILASSFAMRRRAGVGERGEWLGRRRS